MTSYNVPDGPKMLRETLCLAQAALLHFGRPMQYGGDVARLQRLIDECDRHRPLGPDGKHDDRHTETCGCEDARPIRRASLEQGFSYAVNVMIRGAAAHDGKDLIEANADLANELAATLTIQQMSVALAALALRLRRSDGGSKP